MSGFISSVDLSGLAGLHGGPTGHATSLKQGKPAFQRSFHATNRNRVFVALVFGLTVPLSAQEKSRGLLFQIGAGLSLPNYDPETEEAMSYADSTPGVDRVKVALDLGLGYAIDENSFITLGIDGAGYDFTPNPRGVGLDLEAKYMGMQIDGESEGTHSCSRLIWRSNKIKARI